MKTIKAKVHRLPTEDKTEIGVAFNGLHYMTDELHRQHIAQYQHLYITTDEEIKVGDWFYNPATKGVLYASKEMLSWNCDTTQEHKGWKKIIASTDPKLIEGEWVGDKDDFQDFKDGIPQISQSFIEEYCKAGGIDEVLVEYKLIDDTIIARQQKPSKEMNIKISSNRRYTPKLNPDNTIIIHPVEEKMYTLKQIKHMFDIGRDSAFQEMHFDEAIKYRDNELNKMD